MSLFSYFGTRAASTMGTLAPRQYIASLWQSGSSAIVQKARQALSSTTFKVGGGLVAGAAMVELYDAVFAQAVSEAQASGDASKLSMLKDAFGILCPDTSCMDRRLIERHEDRMKSLIGLHLTGMCDEGYQMLRSLIINETDPCVFKKYAEFADPETLAAWSFQVSLVEAAGGAYDSGSTGPISVPPAPSIPNQPVPDETAVNQGVQQQGQAAGLNVE